MFSFKIFITAFFCAIFFLTASPSFSATKDSEQSLLIIGSSYANHTTRLDDLHLGSLGGAAVGSGNYLSLGSALIRNRDLNGHVVNEAGVGSTTFDRFSCLQEACLPFGYLTGYDQQFENTLKRVAIYDPLSPQEIVGYNAKVLIISMANDCIHSDAFGIPQQDTSPCTLTEINQTINTIIRVADKAKSLGLEVIIPLMPRHKDLELDLVKQGLAFNWVANKEQYNLLRSTHKYRLKTELNDVYIINPWKKFTHRGDGIHPDRKTATRAARKIARLIKRIYATKAY